MTTTKPLFENDAIVFGLLMAILGFVFYSSKSKNKYFKRFYKIVPALLMCYLLPSMLNSFGIISKDISKIYLIAKNYLLPAALILMTLSINLKALVNLGTKPLIMFFTGTVGIVIGGPIAIFIISMFNPDTVGGAGFDAVWRGLATLAGSWIGGGANQVAMLEVYQYNLEKYGSIVLVDIIVANIWMAILLIGIGKKDKIDKKFKADSSSIEELKTKMDKYSSSMARITTLDDLIKIFGITFFGVALSHLFAELFTSWINSTYPDIKNTTLGSQFFWIVVISTTIGLTLSFTKAKQLEGVGASKIGSVFIYILVATIGMKMDIFQIFDNLDLMVVGLIWMAVHVILLHIVARIIKAPFFFLAVGSTANIGGAASAPIIAASFHPALTSVGVLLAIFGYALGTYGATLCAMLMEIVSP